MASQSQRAVREPADIADDIDDSDNKLEIAGATINPPSEVKITRDLDSPRTCLECPVCLQPCVHPVQLPCSHVFCFLCVKGVANRSKRCALCRQEIPLSFFHNPKLVRKEDLQKTVAFEDGYQWFYEGRNGWWQYDERTSSELEEKHKLGEEKTFELLIAGFLYVIDLDSMLQYRRNDPTRRRRVKRDLVNIPEKKGIAGLRTVSAVPGNRPGAYGVETSGTPAVSKVSAALPRPPGGDGPRGPNTAQADTSSSHLPSVLAPADTTQTQGSNSASPNQTLSGMLDQLRISHNGDGHSTSPTPNPQVPAATPDPSRTSSLAPSSALNAPMPQPPLPCSHNRRRQQRSSSRSPSANGGTVPDLEESHGDVDDSSGRQTVGQTSSRLDTQPVPTSQRADQSTHPQRSPRVSPPSSTGDQRASSDHGSDSQIPGSDQPRVRQPATGQPAEHPPRPRRTSQQNNKQTRV